MTEREILLRLREIDTEIRAVRADLADPDTGAHGDLSLHEELDELNMEAQDLRIVRRELMDRRGEEAKP
jgi:hypothetical protein